MAEKKWTPEPWSLDQWVPTHIEGPGGRGVCSTGGYQTNSDDAELLLAQNEANAVRIVACVNEMAGLDPEKLRALREAWQRRDQVGSLQYLEAWRDRMWRLMGDFLREGEDS